MDIVVIFSVFKHLCILSSSEICTQIQFQVRHICATWNWF